MRVLIVGASGNLGTRFADGLLAAGHRVRMTFHRTALAPHLSGHPLAQPFQLDLEDFDQVARAVADMDAILFCAGRLFVGNPGRVLPRTNREWPGRVVQAALSANLRCTFVLMSFPHIEEGTTPDNPATGRQDVEPVSIHALTRLQAELDLGEATRGSSVRPIILRAGVVYGSGVKLIEAAHRLMRWRLLATWRAPTWVHLIHITDLVATVIASIESRTCRGIYQVCDQRPVILQEFLDRLAMTWGLPRPIRLPAWCFWTAAWACEFVGRTVANTVPLNVDIMRMAMTSAVADTQRFRTELLPDLTYPTLDDGLKTMASGE